MEALDIKQEHRFFNKKVALGVPLKRIINKRRERDLSEAELRDIYNVLNRKLKPQGMGDFFIPKDDSWWKLALDIVTYSNIDSSDAVHLAQAISMGSDILVTTDNFFCKEANLYLKDILKGQKILICSPKEAIDKIIV